MATPAGENTPMDSDRSKTRFLTAIGHDLRQPLHALLLYLAALDRRVKDEETRTILGKADQAAQSLACMIEGLIHLARIDAGKVETEFHSVDIQEIFDEMVATVPGATADATALAVRSDPALLRAIMQQLVSNADTHGGGKPHLSATSTDAGVEIQVRDDGPGIEAKDQARIFEEFTRLDGAPSTGLGIGLAIAAKLAALLSHKIEVRSALGEGATFVVHASPA